MLSTFGTKNYTANFAQPTKIHGRPTFLQIRKLEKELTKNAASVQCDLGSGAHGYIGLVKSAQDYNQIAPGIAFNMPAHPGNLTIPANTSGHESFRLQQNHLIAVDKYQEAVEIKKALGRMIDNAIDSDYISEFYDDITGLINTPIHEVLQYLYEFYGEVTRDDLKIVERDVENMNYTLQQPPTVIWKAIDDLQRLAIAAKRKYTDEQLVDLGLSIIKTTHDFEKGQDEWIDKPTNDKTYTNLKKHFNKAYRKLQKMRGEDMRGSAQHHANAVRVTLGSNNDQLQEDMLDKVNALKNDIIDVITAEKENKPPLEQSMNAVTVSSLSKVTSLLESLEQRTNRMEQTCLQSKPGNNTTTNAENPNYHIPPWKQAGNKLMYCWSCGCQKTHAGSTCTRKKERHDDTATFENRKGGSHKGISTRFR